MQVRRPTCHSAKGDGHPQVQLPFERSDGREGGTASSSTRRTASYLVPAGRHYPEFSADLTRLNDINAPQRQPTMSLRDLRALHCE